MSHALSYDDESPEYQVKHWRNLPQEHLDTLEEFLDWYKDYLYMNDEDDLTAKSQEMEQLINLFLGASSKAVRAGEEDMLKKWSEGALKP